MLGELRLVELPTRRKGEDGVDEDGDALVPKEVKDAARVLQAGSLVSLSSAGCFRVDWLMWSVCRPAYIIVRLSVNAR